MKTSMLLVMLLASACFLAAAPSIEAKKFMRCQLTKELLQKYQFNKTFLSNWICLIEHESNSDTRTVTMKWNGSISYGLFQISSREWCGRGRKSGFCNKKCEDFTDDNIEDDVECAKLIFQQEGFKHWQGWNKYCRNTNSLPDLQLTCKINSL